VKFRDYYEILGVTREAKPDEIKRAYRKAARKHHPDVAKPADRAQAEEEIKLVNEAYEVLRDPKKRARYDALGANWKSGDDFAPPNGAGPRGGARGVGGEAVDFEDFSDFFSSLFGDIGVGGGRRRVRQRGPMRGHDVEAELALGVSELLAAGKRRITLGQGRALDVEIPKGARTGTVLRLAGQGEPGALGGPPGDLYMHLRVKDDGRFRVEGDDLAMDLPLWPWQAVLGATVRTDVPDGAVDLKIAPGTARGARLRLKGQGLPRADGSRGELYAVVRIEVPTAPSPDETKAYEALRDAARVPKDRPASE
jgi:curved DNA-binding protein